MIRRRIRRKGDGVDINADVNATFAVNSGERGRRTRISNRAEASVDDQKEPRPRASDRDASDRDEERG